MALGVLIGSKPQRGPLSGVRPWALLGLALASASCVPATARQAPLALTGPS